MDSLAVQLFCLLFLPVSFFCEFVKPVSILSPWDSFFANKIAPLARSPSRFPLGEMDSSVSSPSFSAAIPVQNEIATNLAAGDFEFRIKDT